MKPAPALLFLLLLASCGPSDAPSASKDDACCKDKAAPAAKDDCCAAAPAKPDACCKTGPARQDPSRDFLLPAGSRTFSVEYVARVPAVPAGTRTLRLWIPVPSSSTVQEIRTLSFSRDPRIGVEPKHGNRIASWDFPAPEGAVEVRMRFECTRREVATDLAKLREEGRDEPGAFEVFRKTDPLVLLDDGIVRGRTGTVEKARAIYDHVVATQASTDVHARFISLCRAAGIASGFEIGLTLPFEKGQGGDHGWTTFRVPGRTWVPVDGSEGRRFGSLPSNRVALSSGRDLVLEPRQDGPPLSTFVDPYAEADGRPVRAEKTWSFKDLD